MLDRCAMGALCKHPRPFGVISAPAVPADLAFFDERFQHVTYFRSLFCRVFVHVKLVEVDVFRLQAAQAVFTFLTDAGDDIISFRDDAFLFVDNIAELRCQDDPVATSCQGLSEHLLAVTATVVGCRVEEVDASIKRVVNGADRFGIVHLSPTHGAFAAICFQPVPGSAYCPTPKTHGAYVKITAP